MTQETTTPVVNNGYALDSVFFSPTTLAFYLGRHYDRAVAAGNWQTDARPVTAEVFDTYSKPPPEGKQRGVDELGSPAWVPVPPLNADQALKRLNRLIDGALNQVAYGWGYTKGIDNATTWATSANPQYAAEGKALATWRDAVWAWAEAVPAGTASIDNMPAAPTRPTTGAAA